MEDFALAAIVAWVILAGGALALWYWKRRKEMEDAAPEYDERQILARGEAWKWAAFAGGGYLFTLQFAQLVEEFPLSIQETSIIGIAAMFTAYMTVAIWKDAYVGLQENESKIIAWMSAFCVLESADVLWLGGGWMELLFCAVSYYGLALLVLRRRLRKREEREEDDG